MTYVLTFAEGILTFISPCILSMLPVYLLYLAGTPAGSEIEGPRRGNRLIVNSLGFVSGFTLVFVAMGAAAAMMGTLLQRNRPLLLMISGTFMIFFGLNFTGVFKIGFLGREKRFSPKVDNLRFPGSVLFGIAFGFGWSPCLGTFLGSALALAGSSETVAEGMLLLLLYSAGLAIPFIVSAAIFENIKSLFGWFSRNSGTIRIISGILLIAAGIWFFKDGLVLALA
ncbi:MAG TPA: cytochrome c biogenesis CcdA family protein [Clostridiales bacterium]|nr:cytochrome c biogenesis CcdA family protein [Clostridiales bacterium]HPV01020.1 cytochrome c biogenesis CcdA family protein [Clostridiales bacterium]